MAHTETTPLQSPAHVVTQLLDLAAQALPHKPRAERFALVRDVLKGCLSDKEILDEHQYLRAQLADLDRRERDGD